MPFTVSSLGDKALPASTMLKYANTICVKKKLIKPGLVRR